MTEAKLQQLKRSFPNADHDVLYEVLLSCNGSLSTCELILSEQLQFQKLDSSRQSNIRKLLGNTPYTPFIQKSSSISKPILLYTKDDVEGTLKFATIHYNFLPEEIADSMLKYIINDDGFSPQEFHLFGNKCISNHSNKVYSSKRDHGYYYNGATTRFDSEYTDDMKIAQCLIEDQVNKEIQARPQLPFQSNEQWMGSLAVCNKFENKSNNLDWHSDRMTYLGPHCIIASLSIGAKREFRVRRQYKVQGKLSPVYSIPLPHNTLLIMHAGFQEEFKHCVSSTTEISPNHISGNTRINLTYRHYIQQYRDHLPMCQKCGFQMDLRRSFKNPRTRGRYIWLCTGSYQNKECNGFHWADFRNDCLYTDDPDECSVWIDRGDKEALHFFKEMIQEKIAAGNTSTSR